MSDEQNAYDRGAQAARDGESRTSNPFGYCCNGRGNWHDWMRGYDSVTKDLISKEADAPEATPDRQTK